MQITRRSTGLKGVGSNSVRYAGLLLLCALISYFGQGYLAALIFLPAALALEILDRYRVDGIMRGQYFSHS
jgi:hypothetical protein